MLHPRLVFALVNGIFAIVLAVLAIAHEPQRRLNRLFALFNLAFALAFLDGLAFLIPAQGTALVVYRVLFTGIFFNLYFGAAFLQDLSGRYDSPGARRMRRLLLAPLAVLCLLVLTPFVFEGFQVAHDRTRVDLLPGPLYSAVMGSAMAWLAGLGYALLKGLRESSGLQRNQLKFLALAALLGIIGFIFRAISNLGEDRPWTYFVPWIAVQFTFAYLIFKFQLLDFHLWMRRLAINAGVYLSLLGLPLLAYSAGALALMTPEQATGALIGYGFLFSFAPGLTGYLRKKSEERRWRELEHQLEFVQTTAERLTEDVAASLDLLPAHLIEVIRDLYWNRMRNPLAYILIVVRDRKGTLRFSVFPDHRIEETVLSSFLDDLADIPALRSDRPFSRLDLQPHMFPDHQAQLARISDYIVMNQVEICLPCVHEDRLVGAILLGSKRNGIFWTVETNTLQLAASNLAGAVRKTELLERERELVDLDAMKKTLISNITHEFKSPLAIVENAVDILLNGAGSVALDAERKRRLLLLIQQNGRRLGGFIADLLDVAKIEQSKIRLTLERLDVGDLIGSVIAMLEQSASERGLSLRRDVSGVLPAMIDGEKIRQTLYNVVLNAIQHTEAGGVTIRAREMSGRVRIEVEDTGPGIPAAYLETIFETFFRLSDPPGTKKGTGLGLAIARGWAVAHGGRIWAESEGPGRGARFIIEIPADADTGELKASA